MTVEKGGSKVLRRLVYSAMCLALALVLPFLTGQVPQIGSMLCPMHLPVLLCGFLCGWPWGLAVGIIAPLLRTLIFHMPPPVTAAAMAFELGTYGAVTGILYRVLPRKPWSTYVALICAMVVGRLVWGAADYVILGFTGSTLTPAAFLAGAVTNAVPGIILQIVLVPLIVMALDRAKLTAN